MPTSSNVLKAAAIPFLLAFFLIISRNSCLGQSPPKRNAIFVDNVAVDWEKIFIDPANIKTVRRKGFLPFTGEVTITRREQIPFLTASTLLDKFDSARMLRALFVVDGIGIDDTSTIAIEPNTIKSVDFISLSAANIITCSRHESAIIIRTKCRYRKSRILGLNFLPHHKRRKKFR